MAEYTTAGDLYNALYGMTSDDANARSAAGLDTSGEVLDYLSNPGYQGSNTSKLNPNTTAKMMDSQRFFKMNIPMAAGKEVHDGAVSTSNQYNASLNPMELVDIQWISSRFMAPTNSFIEIDRYNRFSSSCRFKASSTKMGCHIAINPRPQFTRFADIKGNNDGLQESKNSTSFQFASNVTVDFPKTNNNERNSLGLGMGRFYSEAIDDNASTVFLEFGVPKFNSIINFITKATSLQDQLLASTGRVSGGYAIAKAIGTYVGWCAFPLITTAMFAIKTITTFLNSQPFSYYYLAPTMHTYWSSVSNIMSHIMTEMGFINPRFISSTSSDSFTDKIGTPMKIHPGDMADIAQYFPKGFINTSTNTIDVYAVAGFQSSIAYKQSQAMYDYFSDEVNKSTMTDSDSGIFKRLVGFVQYGELGDITGEANTGIVEKYSDSSIFQTINNKLSLQSFLSDIFGSDESDSSSNNNYYSQSVAPKTYLSSDEEKAESSTVSTSSSDDTINVDLEDATSADPQTRGFEDKWGINERLEAFGKQWDSVMRDGVKWAVFNVDYTGEQTDSFSNSYSDIDLGNTIKSVSSAARHIKFSTADGNILPGMGALLGTIKNVAAGLVDGVTFGLGGALASLFNGAFIDLPKKWDDSSISISSTSYTIDLVSPYGNPFSQIQNIYLPLAMLLAGTLPLYAGEAAYTSPFLCSVFNKGTQIIRLGMITSLSITRGTGNLGFNRAKRPLGFRVSFTVSDFSNIMTAPINSSILKMFVAAWRDDSKFSDYIGVLVSRDLYTQTYFRPKAILRLSRMLIGVSNMISPYNVATRFSSGFLYNVISPFVSGRILGKQNDYNAVSQIISPDFMG